MSARAGVTLRGCLFTLLVLAVIGYVGVKVGDLYFRYLEYKDAMKQEVRFRSQLSPEQIRANLQLVADSIGLPADAGRVTIHKERGQITVEAHYADTVVFPFMKREIRFSPRAVGTY